jgi:hypothetical protein
MPAVKRRLFNVAAILSLLLCCAWIAALVFLVVQGPMTFSKQHGIMPRLDVSSNRIALFLFKPGVGVDPHWPPTKPGGWVGQTTSDVDLILAGRSESTIDSPYPQRVSRSFLVVYFVRPWECTVFSAMLPALWVIAAVKRRNARRVGRCRICGYDLRATPERCPECGTAVKPVA